MFAQPQTTLKKIECGRNQKREITKRFAESFLDEVMHITANKRRRYDLLAPDLSGGKEWLSGQANPYTPPAPDLLPPFIEGSLLIRKRRIISNTKPFANN